jgi:hypothetical protein
MKAQYFVIEVLPPSHKQIHILYLWRFTSAVIECHFLLAAVTLFNGLAAFTA